MQNVVEVTWNVNVLRNIMVVEFEVLLRHQVLNVFEVTSDEVVHGYNMASFFDKAITKV
jgi:hypothetical protein